MRKNKHRKRELNASRNLNADESSKKTGSNKKDPVFLKLN